MVNGWVMKPLPGKKNKMIKAFVKLFRLPNLLIIAITQYMMRYFIIRPFLNVNNFELQFNNFHFFLLVLSTVFIAAAGYTINDYFDTKTDRLNKPERVVIDKVISRRFAIKTHTILNVLGLAIGVYLSFYIHLPGISLIFLLASGLLWFYSTNYKKEFLVGNIIVSLLTGIVPLMVILFELPLLNEAYGDLMKTAGSNFNYIFFWVAGFAFFAFITNFIREIIKDAEDFEGDSAYGMNTIPIVLGIKTSKWIISILILAFLSALVLILFRFIILTSSGFDYISSSYFVLLVILPSFFVLFKIFSAENPKDYHLASVLMKYIMLAGILYSPVVYFIMEYHLN